MPTTHDKDSEAEGISLSKIVRVRRRFLRSVNLERDFYTSDPLDGYILTASALSTLERLATGVSKPYARAVNLTGAYGSGKSAFALFAAKSLATPLMGSLELRARIRLQDPKLAETAYPKNTEGFWPILITGSRQPIGQALLAGLQNALANLPERAARAVSKELRSKWTSVLDGAQSPNALEVTQIFAAASSLARKKDSTCRGLLVVIDEAGKFLEYAAIHPEQTDIHVLQELAEHAVRSEESPLFLVTVLHQAFDEYAHRLSAIQRDEWQKIQGRFVDIAFGDGPEETVHLIAQAVEQHDNLGVEDMLHSTLLTNMDGCRTNGVFPAITTATEFQDILRCTYPIHPLTLRLLPYVFRRFGQSERSLFSFLSSDEPYGFQEFLQQEVLSHNSVPLLRIDLLYDYVVSSLHSVLYAHATAKMWSEAEEALFRLRNRDLLQSRVIKTIALLQILGEQTRILPTREILRFSLVEEGISQSDVDTAIAALQTQTLITYRQFRKAYRLYEGSDIDVDVRLREARTFFSQGTDGVVVAQRLSITPPLVARRHSYETGTLRFFEVRYCRPATIKDALATGHPQSDGLLLLCLASDSTELATADQTVRESLSDHPDIIVGLSLETEALHEAAVALECLQWVQDETPELVNDRVAAREVRERLLDATHAFVSEWERLLRPRGAAEGGIWYHMGERVTLGSYRQLQVLVSQACEKAYPYTPRLLNELVNRRQLSSTAAAARRNLIQAMMGKVSQPRLGIEGFPPEVSMYVSVLESTGIHRCEGTWGFYAPDESRHPALAMVWKEIESYLFHGNLEPRPLNGLGARLKAQPYGLADGVIPLLLCAVLLHYNTDVAVYEEGRFVIELDIATFERMIKRPEDYKLQGCRIAGERQLVLDRFARGLLRSDEERTLINVVRQLYRVFNKLPEYTVRTRRLNTEARALRDIFKEGKEPEQLLFVDLPRLLSTNPFVDHEVLTANTDEFFAHWNVTMSAVVGAYGELLSRIETVLCGTFSVKDWQELRIRAVNILPHITEARLQAFVTRASNAALAREKWLESVAAVVLGRPPFVWSDIEEDRFSNLLVSLVGAFKHSELLMFEKHQVHDETQTGMRLTVTMDTGVEDASVVFTPKANTPHIRKLADALRQAFDELLQDAPQNVRIAVIGQVAQEILRGKIDE